MLGHVCAHSLKSGSERQQSFSTNSHVIPVKLWEVELRVKKGSKQVLGLLLVPDLGQRLPLLCLSFPPL